MPHTFYGILWWCKILGHHFNSYKLSKSLSPFINGVDVWFRVTIPSRNFLISLHTVSPFIFVHFLLFFKVLPPSTMFSFLFDSAIDIGGSDSGGLIEQPMMDWEVISIDGSSLKDTSHGASDSKSSSLERVEMLGHLPACDIAIALGHHCPHLPLLAMNGWGMMFWSISPLSPLWRASLLYNARLS